MAGVGEITHTTTYRYSKAVTFGTHRAMFLPRRGATARLLSWSVKTSPSSKVHWISDARSNAVTVFEFSEPGGELKFTFRVRGIYRHFVGSSFQGKGIKPLYAEIDSTNPKGKFQFAARLAEFEYRYSI